MNKRFIILLTLIVTLPTSLAYFYFPGGTRKSGNLQAWQREFRQRQVQKNNPVVSSDPYQVKLPKGPNIPEYDSFLLAAKNKNCGTVYLCYVPVHPWREFTNIRYEKDKKNLVGSLIETLLRPLYASHYHDTTKRIIETFYSLNDPDYYRYLGRYHHQQSGFAETHLVYSKYMREFDTDKVDWSQLANFYDEYGKFKQALICHENSLRHQSASMSSEKLKKVEDRIKEIKGIL